MVEQATESAGTIQGTEGKDVHCGVLVRVKGGRDERR